jgi:uncharacterized cupin superfamily protein
MSTIKVERATDARLRELGVDRWSSWGCGAETFDWTYDDQETAYVQEGRVTVREPDGSEVTFGAGDIVVFPQGLSCTWIVHEPIRKVFRFG